MGFQCLDQLLFYHNRSPPHLTGDRLPAVSSPIIRRMPTIRKARKRHEIVEGGSLNPLFFDSTTFSVYTHTD